MDNNELSGWQRVNRWIRKYWGAWIGKLVDGWKAVWGFLEWTKEVWDRVAKATIDTANLIWAETAKLPGNIIDLWNEAVKFWGEVVTWNKSKENFVDKWNDTINKNVDAASRRNLLTNLSNEDVDTARGIASFAAGWPMGWTILKWSKLWGAVIGWAKTADKIKKTKAAETFVEKSNKAFAAFISKDKKIKKLTTEIKDLTKRFEKTKKNLTPEQIVLMEKHIAEKQWAINALVAKGKTKVAADMKKKLKLDKDIDKIVNPKDPTFWKKSKYAAWLASTLWVWVIAADKLVWDEDDETTSTVIDGPDVPTPEGVESDTSETGDQTLDTAWEEKKSGTDIVPTDDGSTIAEDKDLTDSVNNEASTSTSWGTKAWFIMDKQGNELPLFIKGGKYIIQKLDWTTEVLATWVTNKNKEQKFAEISY